MCCLFSKKHWQVVVLALAGVLVLLWSHGFLSTAHRDNIFDSKRIESPRFVDEQQCKNCHGEQLSMWQKSHHALSMQRVTPESVLGEFNGRTFSGSGSSARFTRAENGDFIVNTEGVSGVRQDFPVKYVFGVAPLQQYLLELPKGRLQAFSVAWDTQQKKWFHLYPHETLAPNDPLHWTQRMQNWNFMCAECHSTDLQKNYDAATDTYATSWFQINVGCQACHGPASNHVQWARAPGDRAAYGVNKGFALDLRSADSHVQIEMCARCHSRRSVIAPHYEYGRRLLDFYRPALLEEALYHADGQQQDEVYEYGSFLQSKMAQKGLRCSDCHNPHSARPKLEGNALCVSCHNAQAAALRAGIDGSGLQKKNYDSVEHHFHTVGQAGSRCIECHAPAKNYMVVDVRIDHSFRIPRPDLTLKIGVPNACNQCHRDKSPQWALQKIQQRYPKFATGWHYGEALAAARAANAGAVAQLRELIGDQRYAAIVRASALALLRHYPGGLTEALATATLHDSDPLVRLEAVTSLADLPIAARQQWLSASLQDPVRAVRIEAARALASLPPQTLMGLQSSLDELEASYTVNFDRPEARVGLADLRAAQGRYQDAENIYRETLRLWPASLEAMVNFAELYRVQHREIDAEKWLREALAQHRDNAVAMQALVFSLIRQQRKVEALALLENAARDTRNADMAYLFGLALLDSGQGKRGVQVMEEALKRAPGNRDLLLALAAQAQATGKTSRAQDYLQRLAAINPDDPVLQNSR